MASNTYFELPLPPSNFFFIRLWYMCQQYVQLHPDGYKPEARITGMAQMLVCVAKQAHQNFRVSTNLTFKSRLARWFRLQIMLHSEATGSTYFVKNDARVIKSVVSILTRASKEEPTHTVAARTPQYPISAFNRRTRSTGWM